MRISQVKLFIFVSTLIVFIVLAISVYIIKENATPETVTISIGDNKETVTIWQEENSKYLFLPRSARMEGGAYNYQTYYGSNIHSIFINTQSKTLKNVHDTKGNKENINIRIYRPDGGLDFIDNTFHSEINGRGSSTWKQEKKPYVVTLPDTISIMGLPKGKKFVLLANAYDESNIRNKVVYDYANTLHFDWTPNTEYADVYINSDYCGLYLITEKIDASKIYSNGEKCTFLCHLASKWQVLDFNIKNVYWTRRNHCIQIDYPYPSSALLYDKICENIEKFESSVYEKQSFDIGIDTLSWIKKILIDEVFENTDADLISSYFYYNEKNNAIYGGPIWDYDQVIGNNNEMNRHYTSFSLLQGTNNRTYYYKLYADTLFKNKLKTYYKDSISHNITNHVLTDIDSTNDYIALSARMNSIRFRKMFDYLQCTWNRTNTLEEIKDHFTQRIFFLDDIYINHSIYHWVQFKTEANGNSVTCFVKDGEKITFRPIDSLHLYKANTWREMGNDTLFDFNQPITSDIILQPEFLEVEEDSKSKYFFAGIYFMVIMVLISLSLFFYKRKN